MVALRVASCDCERVVYMHTFPANPSPQLLYLESALDSALDSARDEARNVEGKGLLVGDGVRLFCDEGDGDGEFR